MIIIKNFNNLKQIKNRDEYIKICELNYANTLLQIIGQNEAIEQILPTEIINMNLENKFLDIRGLGKSGKIIIIEGQTSPLKRKHLERYYDYHKESFCNYSKEVKSIILCLSQDRNLKKIMSEENICYKPYVVEVKKINGEKYLKKIRRKFEKNIELTHDDCGILVHLPLFNLPITEKEYVNEICNYIKNYNSIPEEEKRIIIPAMYLNIQYYIDDEYEQEKLLRDVNMLKYCENALDKKIRLAREDEAKKITKNMTEKIKLAREDEAKNMTEQIAKKLIQTNQTTEYIQKITGLTKKEINELRLTE